MLPWMGVDTLQALMQATHAAASSLSVSELADALVHLRPVLHASWAALHVGGDVTPYQPRQAITAYPRELAPTDPWFRAVAALEARPRIVPVSRLVPSRELKRSAIYDAFYHGIDLDHMTCVWLNHEPFGSAGMIGAMFGRSGRHGPFSVREEELLGLLLPHLVAAERRISRLATIEAQRNALSSILEARGDHPMLLIGPSGEPAWISQPARAWLGPGAQAGPSLPPALRHAVSVWRAGDQPPPPTLRIRTPAGRTLLAEISLFGAAEPGLPHRGRWLLVELSDAAEDALTPSETRIFASLKAGLRYREIAREYELSVETVRTHAKRIYRKLGVASQVELILRR